MSSKNPSKADWREARYYQRLFSERHEGSESLPTFSPTFMVLDGRKFIDLDQVGE